MKSYISIFIREIAIIIAAKNKNILAAETPIGKLNLSPSHRALSE
jgi:hypothetical protein